MTGGRLPSVAALTVSAPSGHPLKDPPAPPPEIRVGGPPPYFGAVETKKIGHFSRKNPFCRLFEFWEKTAAKVIGKAKPIGRLQAGFLWIALADSGAFLSVNHFPTLCIPHGLEYPLGSRMHLVVVHPRLKARGQPSPRSPWFRSRVNLRVLRPLIRGPQGQPSPLRTPHGRPGVQGIFPTSRGQVPHGWPMVHHSMATGFPNPKGLLLGAFRLPAHPMSHSPLPHPGTGPFLASHGLPTPSGCCAALATHPSPPRPLVPSSRVYTPPGCQQPCGAGPLDPLPSGNASCA